MRIVICASLLFCFFTTVSAQNLVPNPSFEQLDTCPGCCSYMHYATGWWEVNNTPDYFNVCNPNPWQIGYGVPHNNMGFQYAYDGVAYAGLIAYEFSSNYREYFGCALLEPVHAGVSYSVSMRLSRSEIWTLASNRIGILFSSDFFDASTPIPLDNYASLWVDSVVTDTSGWSLVEWNYTPQETYKYIYIGNFFDDSSTDTIQFGSFMRAYYFIDDVRVVCQGSCSGIGISPIVYDGSSKSIKLFGDFNQMQRVQLHDLLGRLVIDQKAMPTIQLPDIPDAIYVATIYTASGQVSYKLFVY
jgi:hypothetical protein